MLVKSNNRKTAAMTIAASVAFGKFRPSPPSASRTTRITAAPTTPASFVRDPADDATAVRLADALTGKPWKKAAAAFAAPSATISRFASTRSPRCVAKLRDTAVVSASVTNAIAAAAISSDPIS